jgi:hypothetical protein
MTIWKAAGIAIVVLFLGAQLIPVERSNPPVEQEIDAPQDVKAILKQSCYDCHSHETVWPWYSRVAPASWLVAYDVHEARKHLDFSAWNRYDAKKRAKKLDGIHEEVEEGDMPLWYYLLMHSDARLSPEQKSRLLQWAQTGQ